MNIRPFLAAALAALPLAAGAATIDVNFTGHVARFTQNDTEFTDIEIGDAVTGSFNFDPDTMTGGTGTSAYYFDTVHDFTLTVAGLTYTSAMTEAWVNNGTWDTFSANSTSAPSGPSQRGHDVDRIQFRIGGDDTLLSGVQGPTFDEFLAMIAANVYGSSHNFVSYADGSDVRFDLDSVTATLRPLETTTVPLPAGLPLLLAGLGAFGLVRRRR